MIYDDVVPEVHAYLQLRNVTFPEIIFPLHTLLQINNYNATWIVHQFCSTSAKIAATACSHKTAAITGPCGRIRFSPQGKDGYTTCHLE